MSSPQTTPRHTLEAKYRRSQILNWVLGAIAVFLAIVVVAQILEGSSDTGEQATAETETGEAADSAQKSGGDMEFVRRDNGDPKAIGDIDAPVVMTEWVDMRCPFCAAFSRDTLPGLISDYVDSGKVRIEFVDVAYFGEQFVDAAVAAQAAANQNLYVEYVSAVFADAPEKGHADLTRDVLLDYAEQVGVPDTKRFTTDLDNPALADEVRTGTQEAQQLGVTAVPFFVAGQTALSGAQPASTFRDYLDESVAAAG